jgi:hypothetical protein
MARQVRKHTLGLQNEIRFRAVNQPSTVPIMITTLAAIVGEKFTETVVAALAKAWIPWNFMFSHSLVTSATTPSANIYIVGALLVGSIGSGNI